MTGDREGLDRWKPFCLMNSEEIWGVVGVLSLPLCLASISFKCKNIRMDGDSCDVWVCLHHSGLVPGKIILPFSTNGDCDNVQSRRVLAPICATAQNNKYEHVKLRFHSKLYNEKHCHGNKILGGCCGGKDAAEEENGGRREGETCGILKPCDGDWAAPVGGCALGKSPKLTIWVTPHQDARTEGPQRLEKRTCGGDHLFPPSSICLVEGGGGN